VSGEANYVYYSAADEHVRALLTESLFHADRGMPDHPGVAHAPASLDGDVARAG